MLLRLGLPALTEPVTLAVAAVTRCAGLVWVKVGRVMVLEAAKAQEQAFIQGRCGR